MMGLFRRKPKQVVELLDSVCFCSERSLVEWPGHYRTKRVDGHEVPDSSRPVQWVEDPSEATGGRFEAVA